MITSAAATRKAPTATAKPPDGATVEASSAAPGVDQAMAMGMRMRRPNQIASSAWPMQRASRPEADSAGLAPTPASPWSTMGKALAKPTTAARMPAEIGWAMDPLEPAATVMEFPVRSYGS
jgi:hypothetical protein